MKINKYISIILLTITTSYFVIGCTENNKTSIPELKDAPLESYQNELLKIAFESVSAMPGNPHIKSRSLAQEKVVMTCLQLNQPKRAHDYTRQITNWRKQLCYANLALYCAQHDFAKSDINYFLTLAAQVPQDTEDWREGQIEAIISQTNIEIEKKKEDTYNFDMEVESLEKLILTEDFDAIQNTLGVYAELYNRFYSNKERRDIIEDKIKKSWDKMPILIRIELLLNMADFSIQHNDSSKALELVNESQEIMNSETWPLRYGIPLSAKIAKYYALSGDNETAKTKLQKALDIYNESSDQILNIDKAGVLRPIAEAYVALEDNTMALEIYNRAIEAGIENPNSRPRAEDLSSTCCSLALNKFNPGAELLARINEIKNGLGDPW